MVLIMNKKLDWAGRSDETLRRKCNCDFATQGERNADKFILFYFNLTSLQKEFVVIRKDIHIANNGSYKAQNELNIKCMAWENDTRWWSR